MAEGVSDDVEVGLALGTETARSPPVSTMTGSGNQGASLVVIVVVTVTDDAGHALGQAASEQVLKASDVDVDDDEVMDEIVAKWGLISISLTSRRNELPYWW